jgi:hypothetical protein
MLWKDKDGNFSKGWIILDVAEHNEDPELDNPPQLMRVINPTDEQYRKAGYTPYEPPAPEPDPNAEQKQQEFEAACAQFRQVCGMIKEFAGLDEFTGGFDEAMEFIQSEAFTANLVQGTYLFSLWQGADKAATYAGSKCGFGQPEWWYHCWEPQTADEPTSDEVPTEEPEDVSEDVPEEDVPEEPVEEPEESSEEPTPVENLVEE